MPLKEQEFYCVKCRERVFVEKENMCVKIYKNSRTGLDTPALKGYCFESETNLTKFIKHDSTAKMVSKYGECY